MKILNLLNSTKKISTLVTFIIFVIAIIVAINERGTYGLSNKEGCFSYEKNNSEITITDYDNTSTCPKDVVIPSEILGIKVTNIGINAFNEKLLTSIEIPSTIKSIAENAFGSNNELIKIINKTIYFFNWDLIINGKNTENYTFTTGEVTTNDNRIVKIVKSDKPKAVIKAAENSESNIQNENLQEIPQQQIKEIE